MAHDGEMLMKAFTARYNPEVGDLVVGRITEVRAFNKVADTVAKTRRFLRPVRYRSNPEGGKWTRTRDRMLF